MQAGFEEHHPSKKKKALILCCLNANVIIKTQSTLNIDILQLKNTRVFLIAK